MGLQRIGHDWGTVHTHMQLRRTEEIIGSLTVVPQGHVCESILRENITPLSSAFVCGSERGVLVFWGYHNV